MASSIAAITTGTGGIQQTADASGNLNLVSGTTTIVAVTSAGAAVTGTLSSTTGVNLATSSGSVGIGTASPDAKLDVLMAGTATPTNLTNLASSSLFLSNNGGGTTGSTVGIFGVQDSTPALASGLGFIRENGANYGTAVTFYTHPTTVSLGGDVTERMRIDSSGNLKFDSGYGSVATAYGCRAWVNFNGTGTVAIRASGNVSSITDNGTGDYTVNFTTAMADTNYSLVGTASRSPNPEYPNAIGLSGVPTTSAVRVYLRNYGSSSVEDSAVVMAVIFR